MEVNVRFAKMTMLKGVLVNHKIPQKIVEETAHECKDCIRTVLRKYAVKLKFGHPLLTHLVFIDGLVLAQVDICLKSFQLRHIKPPDHANRHFGLEQLTKLIDMAAIKMMEMQKIAQRLRRVIHRNLLQICASAGSSLDLN